MTSHVRNHASFGTRSTTKSRIRARLPSGPGHILSGESTSAEDSAGQAGGRGSAHEHVRRLRIVAKRTPTAPLGTTSTFESLEKPAQNNRRIEPSQSQGNVARNRLSAPASSAVDSKTRGVTNPSSLRITALSTTLTAEPFD